MDKADLIIIAGGVIILAALAAGVGLYVAQTGTDDGWEPRSVGLEPQEGEVGPSFTDFPFTAPPNATGAHVRLDLAFEGQAVLGGQATIRADLVGPDGTVVATRTEAMRIPEAAGSAIHHMELDGAWAEAPGSPTASPFQVRILVEPPGDVAAASSYGFHATIHATALTHQRAGPAGPTPPSTA